MPFVPDARSLVRRSGPRRLTLALFPAMLVLGAWRGGDTSAREQAPGAAESAATSTPAFVAAPPESAARLAPPPPAALLTRLASEEQAAVARVPAGTGHDLVVGNCLICHSATMIEQQHKDTTGWNKTVTQMVAWGAPLRKEQQPALVAYLAESFPARAEGPPAPRVP